MKTVQATALRRNLFETLKRLAYEKDPILIERRGRAVAALVPAESVVQAKTLPRAARPTIDPKALADLCDRRRIKTLYLFGSILTDSFDSESDIDVMFDAEGPSPGYFEQMEMADEFESLLGRPVDLVSKRAIESSPNPFRKRSILESARVVYAR